MCVHAHLLARINLHVIDTSNTPIHIYQQINYETFFKVYGNLVIFKKYKLVFNAFYTQNITL